MKLTIKNAAGLKLPAGKTDHIEFDSEIPGFGLRIRKSGNRSWIFQYRIAGMTRRHVIGKATAIPADEAREIAWKLHGKVKEGGDPATERHVRMAEATKTFGNLVADYLETKTGELRPRSLVEVRRHLDLHLAPLHKLPMTVIGLETVAARLDAIAK
jgi:hypothetical protein